MKQLFFVLFVIAFHGISATGRVGPTIAIGSTNKVKVESLQNVIEDYSFLSSAKIVARSVPSEVSDQPKSLNETIIGAKNRAKNAFQDCELSFGIESGIMKIRSSEGELCFDITVCAVFDGSKYRYGFSCSFELPSCVTCLIDDPGFVLGDAMRLSGLTNKHEIGKEEGSIGVLSFGRVSRKDYTEQAIKMALIPLENSCVYECNPFEETSNIGLAR